MPFHYGPQSYYSLGRVYPRDRLREPYYRAPWGGRFNGVLVPPPPPFFERTTCPPPPASVPEAAGYALAVLSADSRPRALAEAQSYPRQVAEADSRPGRVGEAESRPGRRDECR